MALRFDHAIILVHDLDAASAGYRHRGFTVVYGGQHAGGKTHNALIVFQDGTYLELLAPTDRTLLNAIDPSDRSNFLYLFQHGEGFGGYALQSDDLMSDVTALQARGLAVQLRPEGGRTRPDGTTLRWQTAAFPDTMTPFLIQDLTPRRLRVPDDARVTTHTNGALGTVQVTLADTPRQRKLYECITGSSANRDNPVYYLAGVEIRLVSAAPEPGDRLLKIGLRTDSANEQEFVNETGVRITLAGGR
ncbi:MAG: VOC family protein [Chloroflexi bacterium]|nr:VOC family protein [Chloroflexota bacterium]